MFCTRGHSLIIIVSYLTSMLLLCTGESYSHCVYTTPEHISTRQQSPQLLSFTVNSLEHISSTTHWFLSVFPRVAVHFVCLHFSIGSIRIWPVWIQFSTFMVTCFPVWILIKHGPPFFSQGCDLALTGVQCFWLWSVAVPMNTIRYSE